MFLLFLLSFLGLIVFSCARLVRLIGKDRRRGSKVLEEGANYKNEKYHK